MAAIPVRRVRPADPSGTPRVRLALSAALSTVLGVLVTVTAPHKASLARLLDAPFAVLGTACIDFAAFHYVHMIGWMVTGISLWVWNEICADDNPTGRT